MSTYSLSCVGHEQVNVRQQWFALSVTPKLTHQILSTLEQKGFEAFTPLQTIMKKGRVRTAEVREPAFPGYVFARMDPRFRLPALITPGVRGIVGYGRQPAPIDDEEIDGLIRVSASGVDAEPSPFLQNGDRVQVVEGPLTGVTGVLLKQKGGNRVLVQVTLISRALAVDVAASWVRLLKAGANDCAFTGVAGQ
jgi:transcription antitermination factor NusG